MTVIIEGYRHFLNATANGSQFFLMDARTSFVFIDSVEEPPAMPVTVIIASRGRNLNNEDVFLLFMNVFGRLKECCDLTILFLYHRTSSLSTVTACDTAIC